MVNHPRRSRVVQAATPVASSSHNHDHDYSGLLLAVKSSFATTEGPLFTTDCEGLWETYLSACEAERQVHTCHACRRFVETYGGLVSLTPDGQQVSAFWQDAGNVPEFYVQVFAAMRARISTARVTGEFLSKERIWGTPQTGSWTHIAVIAKQIFIERSLTAFQAMAAGKENYRTVARALGEFKLSTLETAIRVLESDHLSRSEKFLAPVRWLHGLKQRPKGRTGENLLWLAIASSPEGFFHPRASMIGSLLEDIEVGFGFAEIKARFEAKVHPLQYQRPQAAPSLGAFAVAEKLVEKLGIGESLHRRFAQLQELELIWKPLPTASQQAHSKPGVFGHLRSKEEIVRPRELNIPAQSISWEKFVRVVMDSALEMEFYVPGRGNFEAILTAQEPEAPPIIKWDSAEHRNPFSTYVYHGGSPAKQWGLTEGSWTKVTGVCLNPHMWNGSEMEFMGQRVTLVLQGAVDSKEDSGNALFSEILKSELHGVRAVVEAYAKSTQLTGRDEASACGYCLGRENCQGMVRVRTTGQGPWTNYKIDRWD